MKLSPSLSNQNSTGVPCLGRDCYEEVWVGLFAPPACQILITAPKDQEGLTVMSTSGEQWLTLWPVPGEILPLGSSNTEPFRVCLLPC